MSVRCIEEWSGFVSVWVDEPVGRRDFSKTTIIIMHEESYEDSKQ